MKMLTGTAAQATFLARLLIERLNLSWANDGMCSHIAATALESVGSAYDLQDGKDLQRGTKRRAELALNLIEKIGKLLIEKSTAGVFYIPPKKTQLVLWEAVVDAWVKLENSEDARRFGRELADAPFEVNDLPDLDSKGGKAMEKMLREKLKDRFLDPSRYEVVLVAVGPSSNSVVRHVIAHDYVNKHSGALHEILREHMYGV